jgi:eukaryotic-like serine/threonine-protein kinase
MEIQLGLFGKYELQERLGRGGMAEVWKAFDPRLQRYVAVKFLDAALQSDPTFVVRFVREARAVASLRHPNIVQIFDFETPAQEFEDVPVYMVMDYIEGPTLADYLRETSAARKFPSPAEMVSLFLSISDAIDYAHQRGLLHRDLKPSNILLDRRLTARNPMGEPMLTDFGIVKILGSAAGEITAATIGTPIYISPEQARGYPGSAASDIYSLGVILYEMCTGTPPFVENSPFAILQQHVNTPPRSPGIINQAISPELAEVILRGLAKDPRERFPGAIALTTALAEALHVPLPDRKKQPISSPDIRLLSDTPEDLEEITELREAVLVREEQPLLPPAIPPTFMYIPSSRVPAFLVEASERITVPVQDAPSRILHPPPATPRRKRSGMGIVLLAHLLVVVVGSGLAVLFVSLAGSSSTNVVGHAFFTSSGAASGANNMGINDSFQVSLSNIPSPQAGKSYYAWLLPDQVQSEANPRALGVLVISNGAATLSSPYVDPLHENLLGSFSRFLVTEEPTSPPPLDPSLNKGTWRYYAEIPQSPPVQNCVAAINQLNALCHLRHLLSGDPELALVNLPGGLNYWFLNNVKKLQQWARVITQANNPVDIRHRVVDMLYVLDGTGCVAQDILSAPSGGENTPDDQTLSRVAAIPLLNCSITSNITGFLSHIHNHLGAMVQSPGVLREQVTQADEISTELDVINAWLQQMRLDARQLVALDNPHLVQGVGIRLRDEINSLATRVLNGGSDPGTGRAEKGVTSIAEQIRQLATMDITRY